MSNLPQPIFHCPTLDIKVKFFRKLRPYGIYWYKPKIEEDVNHLGKWLKEQGGESYDYAVYNDAYIQLLTNELGKYYINTSKGFTLVNSAKHFVSYIKKHKLYSNIKFEDEV